MKTEVIICDRTSCLYGSSSKYGGVWEIICCQLIGESWQSDLEVDVVDILHSGRDRVNCHQHDSCFSLLTEIILMRHNFANCWPFSSARKATRIVAERPPFLVFIRALRGRSTRNVPNEVCPVLTFNLLVPWEKVIADGGVPPTAMRKRDGWRGDERRLPTGGVFVIPHAKSRFSCLATVCQRRDAGITSLRWKSPRCEWRRGHVTGTYLVDDWSECGWGCIHRARGDNQRCQPQQYAIRHVPLIYPSGLIGGIMLL